ncbi:MAG TPA: CBS domain-containing protein [Anaerolineales bacterium]|nr:CBS domain-containing protein [Anaerolineales bacterium]
MAFISELTGRPVTDIDGTKIGVLKDLVARPLKDLRYPVVDAIVVQGKAGDRTLPYSELAALLSAAIPLKRSSKEIAEYQIQDDDIRLVADVLDKQILDTDGARVVRVNDIELVRVNGDVVVSNVDIGVRGILRRIGLDRLGRWTSSGSKDDAASRTISWEFVEPLTHDQSMRLKVPASKLADLHPSDIAEIISDLNRAEHSDLLNKLDIKQLADTLEEVEPDFQADLLEHFPDEKVADVLEEMSPDEATDYLAELPDDRRQGLLKLMEADEAEEVRELLRYDEDTAGGLMTTEYVAVTPDMTAGQAIEHLRKVGEEAELLYYVYVIDQEEHLLGVFSLSDLIVAQPDTPITYFMHKRVISVELGTHQDEIAHIVAKYNLIAVPVVDAEEHLHGIVTADDALDKVLPTAWKKRLPHFLGTHQ